MFVSLNEVESTVRKAFRGAGYHWGEAEEVGKAAVWLARRRLPVMRPFLELLRSLDGTPASRRPVVSASKWRSASRKLCPVLVGIALADAARDLEAGTEICFESVLTPIILAPFASLAALASNLNLLLDWQGNRIVVQGDKFHGNFANAEQQATVILRVHPPSDALDAMTFAEEKSLDTGSELWAELNRFAAETYVPASEKSRTLGAGAGLTDND